MTIIIKIGWHSMHQTAVNYGVYSRNGLDIKCSMLI